MSKVWIIEFDQMPIDASGKSVIAPNYPPNATQEPLTIGAASVVSAAFSRGTRFVLLGADGDCCFVVGMNPIAMNSDTPLFAREKFFIGVVPGQRIAVIQQ